LPPPIRAPADLTFDEEAFDRRMDLFDLMIQFLNTTINGIGKNGYPFFPIFADFSKFMLYLIDLSTVGNFGPTKHAPALMVEPF